MNSVRHLAMLMMSALAVLAAGSAGAQPFYASSVIGTLRDQNGVVTHVSSGTSLSPTPTNSSIADSQIYAANGNSSNAHGGTVSAQVLMSNPATNTNNGGVADFLEGDASLSYNLALTPAGNRAPTDTSVPVDIRALGGIEWSQDGVPGAEFLVRSNQTGAVVVDELLEKRPGVNFVADSESFFLDQIFNLDPHETYQVFLSAFASGFLNDFNGTGDPGGMQVTASIDPTFTVVGAAAADWTISGVPLDTTTGTGGVPEPASWALMVLGLSLAGGGLRASRRRAALA
jgi:hypothetical protein